MNASAQQGKYKPAPELELQVISDHEVQITWQKVRESLYLERKLPTEDVFKILGTFEPSVRHYQDSDLPLNEEIIYRLRPVQSRYLDQYGIEKRITIQLPEPQPPFLQQIDIDGIRIASEQAVEIKWTIVVEKQIDGIFTPIGEINPGANSFTDNELNTNEYHYYRLRNAGARNTSEHSSCDSIYLDFAPPFDLIKTYLNDHTVCLNWKKGIQYPCQFEIEKVTKKTTELIAVAEDVLFWTDDEVPYNTYTYYRVRGKKGDNKSEFSNAITVHINLDPVENVAVDSVRDCAVQLTWKDQLGLAAGYIVERATGGASYREIARLDGEKRSYTDSLDERGKELSYRIVTLTSTGLRIPSDTVEETIPEVHDGMVYIPTSKEWENGFYLDASEVSAELYRQFCLETERDMPDDPSFQDYPYYWLNPTSLPAVNVSWFDAIEFCNWRSWRLGLEPAYTADGRVETLANGFRLPDTLKFLQALSSCADSLGNFWGSSDSWLYPQAPDTLAIENQKLQHLLGNVWEWTQDETSGGAKIIIGGSFTTPHDLAGEIPQFCYVPLWKSPTIGFRCVLPLSNPKVVLTSEKTLQTDTFQKTAPPQGERTGGHSSY